MRATYRFFSGHRPVGFSGGNLCGAAGTRRWLIRLIAAVAMLSAYSIGGLPRLSGQPAAEHDGFAGAARSARDDLDAALRELAAMRERIADERIPLAREQRSLETETLELRRERDDMERRRDADVAEANGLEMEVRALRDELVYIENLATEYLGTIESKMHVSELPLRDGMLAPARAAVGGERADLGALLIAVEQSVGRLRELAGGLGFEGEALAPDGTVVPGRFALVGPLSFFADRAGELAGVTEERPGSLYPRLAATGRARDAAIRELAMTGAGRVPVDVTGGNALRRAEGETIFQQLRAGGVVMIPILLLAAAALVIAIIKWTQIAGMKVASPDVLQDVLAALSRGEREKAGARAALVTGPVGEMLQTAVQHAHEKKELIEEILYERILAAQPRLERLLPFIAVTAATAPLLGLLGTVTGMINTFQLITLVGTGDARSLSGGIYEALITTKFGLVVAIPALLIHALLSRKARGIISSMEQTGVAFLNGISWNGEVVRTSNSAAVKTPAEKMETEK